MNGAEGLENEQHLLCPLPLTRRNLIQTSNGYEKSWLVFPGLDAPKAESLKTAGGRDPQAPTSRHRHPHPPTTTVDKQGPRSPLKGSASSRLSDPRINVGRVVSHPTGRQLSDMGLGPVTIGLIDLQERDIQNRRLDQREQLP